MDKNGWYPNETKIYSIEEIKAAKQKYDNDRTDMVLFSIYLLGMLCWVFAVCG